MLERLGRRATTSGRIDDNPDIVRKRLQTFSKENLKVEEYLRNNGKFYEVSSS
jgi:adenylate kinase family enzyme